MGGKREAFTLCHHARPAGNRRPNQTCVTVGSVCKCFLVPAKPHYRGSKKGGGSFGDEGGSKRADGTTQGVLETTKGEDPGRVPLPSLNLG